MESLAMTAALQIYLVRHGETAWSVTGQHTGHTDLALTANGRTEARALGLRLRDVRFARVFASPRERARQTCELAGLGATPDIEPDLGEWDYGAYEARRTAEIREQRSQWNIFADGCPDGESPGQISHRADRLIARLRELSGNIALFTHGHFGRVLGVRWIGLPVGAARHLLLGPVAVSVLGYDRGNADEPVIIGWNAGSQGATAAVSHDEVRAAKKRAVDRWENEGGEIPHAAPSHAG